MQSLRNLYYQQQREYNRIIDQKHLSNLRNRIIIDSFDDYSTLSLLDPVEVDLGKRLSNSSFLSRCNLLTENNDYRFYRCDFSTIREEKKSGTVVYFGYMGDVACAYRDKLYWFDYGSILSDKYISRCNVEDGQNIESFDWLSNEKTPEFMGESCHIVSEDRVIKMDIENDCLVIYVNRKSLENASYIIRVHDNGNVLLLSKTIISGDFSTCDDFGSFELC